jgi:hypothetical protein
MDVDAAELPIRHDEKIAQAKRRLCMRHHTGARKAADDQSRRTALVTAAVRSP